MDPVYDLESRLAYQRQVEVARSRKLAAKQFALESLAAQASNIKVLVAVATRGDGKINEHFGHANEFQVYELSTAGAKFIGHRRVDHYCQGGYGDEDVIPTVIRAINDCHAVFVAKIGGCPREALMDAGIAPVESYAFEFIEKSLLAWFKNYLARVGSGEIEHTMRGDAAIRQRALTAAA
jgi:nitrogen fixation protein NifB